MFCMLIFVVQWLTASLIFINTISDQKLCRATFDDIEFLRAYLPEWLLSMKILTLQLIFCAISASLHVATSIRNSLNAT